MSERVKMPALGESVTEGTVTRWLKGVGDTVEIDEPLLEVSTDKVDTEIPSPIAGTLQEILVQEDDTVPVGADLAVIGDGDAPAASEPEAAPAEAAPEPAPVEAEAAPAEAAPAPAPAESAPAEQAAPQGSADTSSDGGDGTTVTMPALGESVTEGTVTRWLKQEGDDVEVDEPLLEVSTDKVDTEIPSPVAGKLNKILVQEDDTVPVGADLAVIGGSGGGSAPAAAAEAPAPEPAAAAPAPAAPAPASAAPAPAAPAPAPAAPAPAAEAPAPAAAAPASSDDTEGRDAAAYVTPLVRKLAADHGIDLATLTGTGIGGRIRKQDVMAAAEAKKAPAPAPEAPAPAAAAPAAPAKAPAATDSRRGTTEKMSRLRQTIARRMVESLQISAQLTTVVEVDVTRIAKLRDRAKADFAAREGTKLSFLPFFALAAVEALKAHPTVNASVDGDQVTYYGAEHLGVAVDTEKGLLVPVLKNAGDLNIAGLARGISDVAERTRNNKIMPDDLSGGTFTITNTGSRGALFDTPIINQPQVAILGTGSVVRRPVVAMTEDGGETIAIRSMVYLALSYDHRIVDGADAARFLTTMKQRLEEGAFEADLGL
ncbi:2-oxoglutarate dehydrogenase, E2 component, dihydrolipoamide succinyltransferase [Ornithinibacter sp.]|uniref:2-oxoglutarate dehydrogenase, E2 component, dihydrolipoamide succinyltransferase n=1 Tax=Ornithinibacter sp. TaxID=2862748 RepID=UPI002CDDDD96|nr:2-oxoglutarate dehydrogenase, E2 component, dihydrolipoamide succinyltransferase [Ornithinibacter sp.]HRA26329.1 2-oxoglutarate dehydrogenase, E2 component, dihydrolipoamide succinyltransferase [Ornithinibacter sp.]